jgi:hypothetical protein
MTTRVLDRTANVPYSTETAPITLTLTPAELQNLQRFHAQRQSRSDDGCVEAMLGYDVEAKLREALEAQGLPVVSSLDTARRG